MTTLDLGQPQIVARFIHYGMLHEIPIDYPPPGRITCPTLTCSSRAATWFPEGLNVSAELLTPAFGQTDYIHDRTEGGIAHYYSETETMGRAIDAAFMRRPLPL